MPGADGIRQAVDALERTLAELEAVAARTDADRKRALIVQRRALAEAMATVQHAASAPGSPFARGEAAEAFHRHFSRVRNAVALHQATWSVVLIDDAPERYRASSRSASAALRDFLAWSRSALGARASAV